ncbi:MAG: hypothetical protein AVDCRST_MAG52-3328, partial [uncultured Blastococcus sp.]
AENWGAAGDDEAPAAEDVGAAVRPGPRRLRRRDRAAPDPPVAPHGERPDAAHHARRARGEHTRRRLLPPGDLAVRRRRLDHHPQGLAAGTPGAQLFVPRRPRPGRLGRLQPGRGADRPPAARRAPRPRRPRRAAELGPRLPGVRGAARRGRLGTAPARGPHAGGAVRGV